MRREHNEGIDELKRNELYSSLRLFDKEKMKYFDEYLGNSHLRLRERKLHKDCLDTGKQLELINKMVSIDSEQNDK